MPIFPIETQSTNSTSPRLSLFRVSLPKSVQGASLLFPLSVVKTKEPKRAYPAVPDQPPLIDIQIRTMPFMNRIRRRSKATLKLFRAGVKELIFRHPAEDNVPSIQAAATPTIEVHPPSPKSYQGCQFEHAQLLKNRDTLIVYNPSRDSLSTTSSHHTATEIPRRSSDELLQDGPITPETFELLVSDEEEDSEPEDSYDSLSNDLPHRPESHPGYRIDRGLFFPEEDQEIIRTKKDGEGFILAEEYPGEDREIFQIGRDDGPFAITRQDAHYEDPSSIPQTLQIIAPPMPLMAKAVSIQKLSLRSLLRLDLSIDSSLFFPENSDRAHLLHAGKDDSPFAVLKGMTTKADDPQIIPRQPMNKRLTGGEEFKSAIRDKVLPRTFHFRIPISSLMVPSTQPDPAPLKIEAHDLALRRILNARRYRPRLLGPSSSVPAPFRPYTPYRPYPPLSISSAGCRDPLRLQCYPISESPQEESSCQALVVWRPQQSHNERSHGPSYRRNNNYHRKQRFDAWLGKIEEVKYLVWTLADAVKDLGEFEIPLPEVGSPTYRTSGVW